MVFKKIYCLALKENFFGGKSILLVYKIKKRRRVGENAVICSSFNVTPNNHFTLAIENSGNWNTFCPEFSNRTILKNTALINRIVHNKNRLSLIVVGLRNCKVSKKKCSKQDKTIYNLTSQPFSHFIIINGIDNFNKITERRRF